MTALILHELPPSPNSVKIRIALGYKGLAAEHRAIDPANRKPLIELSGQPKAPILQHGDTVLFDSGAILRYLDANFRDTPQLYSADYDELSAIERWELFARTDLGPPIGAVFGQFFAPSADPQKLEEAALAIHAATAGIEERLGQSDWLLGDRLTAADVVCGAGVHLATLPESARSIHPILAFFQERFPLGEGRERTRAWVDRLRAYDRTTT